MTRKEVRQIIADNPGKKLYACEGNRESGVCLHSGISKTTAITNARLFHSFKVGLYSEQRPDLQRYADRGRPVSGWDDPIITFDATYPIPSVEENT